MYGIILMLTKIRAVNSSSPLCLPPGLTGNTWYVSSCAQLTQVFGEVLSGYDVVQKIETTKKGPGTHYLNLC
jgi:cyclophilin family peptidyl-prolyl cis-trans isomerase